MGAIEAPSGDELLKVLAALGNPHRMRIVAALAGGRNYVSGLAREIGMSRPLLHMHLQRLEAAGLVVGTLELSDSGKAMKFFEVAPFGYALTPQAVAEAARTLTDRAPDGKPAAPPGGGARDGKAQDGTAQDGKAPDEKEETQ
ncbi:winged helix-turn-helix domain-containing protein [Streptomyces sp. NPDC006992]|uniref:ArsR/SmtB family transcription factor n=1 Tax=unclassified Streptomyces TaxID=2593676 RepID=UPI0033E2E4C5